MFGVVRYSIFYHCRALKASDGTLIANGCRGCDRLVEEVARWWGSSSRRIVLGGLFLEMTDDLVDDRGLSDD